MEEYRLYCELLLSLTIIAIIPDDLAKEENYIQTISQHTRTHT